ncbi:MAG: hypothetical protein WAJ86_07875, partial [Candidatus Acidiferrales bacterium]
LLVECAVQDILVSRSFRDLCNRNDVVTGLPQRPDDRPSATLVGHEVHALGFIWSWRVGEQYNFLVGYTCGAVGHGCSDILCCEVRIILQQISLACALGEFAQD